MKKYGKDRCIILACCLLGCGVSLAQDSKNEESRAQAIQGIRMARLDAIRKRTLNYYVAQIGLLQGVTNETVAISTGSVILAGQVLSPPYQVSLGSAFISINGLSVEPRFTIVGQQDCVGLPESTGRAVMAAELISKKKESLYAEMGDYTLVIPRLVSYAKSLNGVEDVRITGSMVTVKFVLNGVTNEVGYICREMRQATTKAPTENLAQEYRDICGWLREGKCVFVPLKDSPRPEASSLVINVGALVAKKPNLKTTLQELEFTTSLVQKCFSVPVSEEDAAVIIANWR